MSRNDWFFAQISDPQFGMFRPGEDDYEETALVVRAIERLNVLRPDFVLCTGDLIDEPCSDRQMEHARGLLGELDASIPFVSLPGNHDVGDVPTAESLEWFRELFGRDRFSFNHHGWHIVGLNSCLMADGSAAPDEVDRQWAWLEEDLDRADRVGAVGTLAFMHHPLFLDRMDEEDDYFNLPAAVRAECAEILQKHGVRTIFSGHLHRCHTAASGGLEAVVTGPVGMPLQDGYSGFRLIRMSGDAFHHEFFGLEDMAGQREFVALD